MKTSSQLILVVPMTDINDLSCDDKELIDEAREGNQSAFVRLVECNQDQLFASINRFLRSHSDAEEAVQEAFIRAFARLDSFDGNSKFSTWLYRIAFNAAITSRRKKRAQFSLDQQYDDEGFEVCDSRENDASAGLLREERVQLVHEALDRLNDDHRAILVLRELDDLAYTEIASALGVSLGTVRSRLVRARDRLREAVVALQHCVEDIQS